MRGFGDTERVPIDATRGLRDWADDTAALLDALGIDAARCTSPAGRRAARRSRRSRPTARSRRSRSSTRSRPTATAASRRDGTPCFPDYAGSGGGTGSPDFTRRLAEGDRSSDDRRLAAQRHEQLVLVARATASRPSARRCCWTRSSSRETGDDGYPGDVVAVARTGRRSRPGTRGILNALSPKHCDWSGIVELDPKPPVLWTHGTADIVVADGAAWEIGTLGQAGRGPRLAGRGARSRRSRWSRRSATSSSATATRAAAS